MHSHIVELLSSSELEQVPLFRNPFTSVSAIVGSTNNTENLNYVIIGLIIIIVILISVALVGNRR